MSLSWTGARLIAGTAALLVVAAPACASAAEAVLRLRGGAGFEFAGNVRSFDGASYVLDAKSFGTLTLEASRYDCIGPGCKAKTQPRPARTGASVASLAVEPHRAAPSSELAIESSDALGLSLMPALIRAHATSTGASLKQLVGSDPKRQRFTATDAKTARVTSIELRRTDSAAALASLSTGQANLALSGRPASGQELAALRRAKGRPTASEHVVGLDGLAVIVAPESPVTVLAIDDVARIFSGKVSDWSQLGHPAGPIRIYASAEKGGAADRLGQIVLAQEQLAVPRGAVLLADEAEVSDAVARDPSGIAVTSMAFVRNARGLDIMSGCGLVFKPSFFAVKAEEYPLSRRMYLYAAAKPRSDMAQSLAGFVATEAGQAALRESQLVDQSIAWSGLEAERGRIMAGADRMSTPEAERQLARQLVASLEGAERLSVTFRFANGSSELDAKARQDLLRLGKLLSDPKLAGRTILLVGFTDSVGGSQANVDLSSQRASRVRLALLQASAGASGRTKIASKGFGAAAPVACNAGERDRFLNRRVEVWALPAQAGVTDQTIAVQRPDKLRKGTRLAGGRRG